MKVRNNKIYADENKVIRRKDQGQGVKVCTLLSGETEANFEEAETFVPQEVYDEKIAEITAFDKSDRVNQFFLDGIPMRLSKDDRMSIVNSTNCEIKEGRSTTKLWTRSVPPIPVELPCTRVLELMAELEVFLLDGYNKTAEHIANVCRMTTIEEIQQYDHTTGYPENPRFTSK